jgi:hypothetical protein
MTQTILKRLMTLVATLGLVLGLSMTTAQQAEARRGSSLAGLAIGALVVGIVAHELSRQSHRRYYSRSYYDYSYDYRPRYYSHRPSYGYADSCRGWRCY